VIVSLKIGRCAALWAGLWLAPSAWAQPPEPEGGAPAAGEVARNVETLPEVVVRPPYADAPVRAAGVPTAVTPLLQARGIFDTPQAVSVVEGDVIRLREISRSLPDAMRRLPGVMLQKTAPMQASPFIRGFTGYKNLMLFDGIRVNNSAFRAGPNQYWSTIDTYSVERLELVRGPSSVLYGSDSIGGTVNVIPIRRESFCPGFHVDGLIAGRGATAERYGGGRLQVEGNYGRLGFVGGLTGRTYGDIESALGRLPHTGGITEIDGDLRFDLRIDRCWSLAMAYYHVGQRDAPRTHSTTFSVPFHGTTVGTELRRDHDQDRDLAYARLSFDAPGRFVSHAHLGVSLHRHAEQRFRQRTGNREDWQGFELWQPGVQLEVRHGETRLGQVTWGADWYHDESNTWTHQRVGGIAQGPTIQGPYGDDGRYDLVGAFVQDEIHLGRRFDLVVGARFTYASAYAGRVDDNLVPGSDPATPGNVYSVGNDWTNVVGSLRGTWHVNRCWNVYGGVAQAFRAPTLHDLTSFEGTSVFELPSPDLDPEQYLTFETGVKTEQRDFTGSAALWYTILDDTIARSPTGQDVMGTPVVRKDNVGDGWVWGFEIEAAWRAHPDWVVFGNLSWLDGMAYEISETTGARVFRPLDRQQPLAFHAGARWEPSWSRVWIQGEVSIVDREDRLSGANRVDTQRIPPAGTPGWVVSSLRMGGRLTRWLDASVAIENVFDEPYRVHGSGVNEPGLNLVGAFEVGL
jgi:hemoglobin/transferrin/lactoferrin receptor protein